MKGFSRNLLTEVLTEKRTYGQKREEVRGGWRKLYCEVFYNFSFSLTIKRAIRLRRIRWAEHIAHTR
jgi:hypothetical protein